MSQFTENQISKIIINSYHQKLLNCLENDVLFVGAGPAGLTGAYFLAKAGCKVTILEKRLSTGGGIWGGGMSMNEVVVQKDAISVLDEFNIDYHPQDAGLYSIDAIELASGLTLNALKAGVTILNLTYAEDACIHRERVTGIVANRTSVGDSFPIDPITFSARAIVDTTGHESVVVSSLMKRNLFEPQTISPHLYEGPMDAYAGEQFVINNVKEVFPGLWISGMTVCATLGGPRMGPIFGGMILSGKRVAEEISIQLSCS